MPLSRTRTRTLRASLPSTQCASFPNEFFPAQRPHRFGVDRRAIELQDFKHTQGDDTAYREAREQPQNVSHGLSSNRKPTTCGADKCYVHGKSGGADPHRPLKLVAGFQTFKLRLATAHDYGLSEIYLFVI